MEANQAFELVEARGWRHGLNNLLNAELGKWFRSNTWWVQSLIWIGVINAILAGLLWSEGEVDLVEAASFFSLFMGLFPTIAIIIIMQDAIVGEKESGTAAWVLSKPLSRSAFVIAKLIANMAGVFVAMLLLPSLVAYLQLAIAAGGILNPLNFLGGLGVIYINMLFYLTLTLMLGTFFNHRGPVIGIPLALAFGQQILFGLLPFLAQVLPWTLVIPYGDIELTIAASIIRGVAPQTLNPLYFAVFLILIFVGLSIWRFKREEF
jgi:ABC-2 type transport system permease protein